MEKSTPCYPGGVGELVASPHHAFPLPPPPLFFLKGPDAAIPKIQKKIPKFSILPDESISNQNQAKMGSAHVPEGLNLRRLIDLESLLKKALFCQLSLFSRP